MTQLLNAPWSAFLSCVAVVAVNSPGQLFYCDAIYNSMLNLIPVSFCTAYIFVTLRVRVRVKVRVYG